ncbi:hypothetical protein XHC_3037 [Xanthomonas hortorum pv. carotae str. M081]|nr:hypothetical protein XHC_3037 [Xanthomonas hortorum pv. carotae str. M081]
MCRGPYLCRARATRHRSVRSACAIVRSWIASRCCVDDSLNFRRNCAAGRCVCAQSARSWIAQRRAAIGAWPALAQAGDDCGVWRTGLAALPFMPAWLPARRLLGVGRFCRESGGLGWPQWTPAAGGQFAAMKPMRGLFQGGGRTLYCRSGSTFQSQPRGKAAHGYR